MFELKNKQVELYQIGDVVEIIGPFKNEPDRQQQENYFLTKWELKNHYDIKTKIVLDDSDYYIEVLIKEIKMNGDDTQNVI